MDYLYSQGKISSKVFALYLTGKDDTDSSTIEIGGYTTTKMRDTSELTYVSLESEKKWTVMTKAFKVGEGKDKKFDLDVTSYRIDSIRTVIDSSESYITFPYSK